MGTGIGADNDSRNPYISTYPHYDYRWIEPVVSSPSHRLNSGQTTTPLTWILAADSADTHGFSLQFVVSYLARADAAHASDIITSATYPHPYGLGYDPTTDMLHATDDAEAFIYGVKLDEIDLLPGMRINPGQGPSYCEVSPAGSDPDVNHGRVWCSHTAPELDDSGNAVFSLDASDFPMGSGIVNVTYTYESLGAFADITEPRGLAYDLTEKMLYIGQANRVLAVDLDTLSGSPYTGFNNIQGLSVDPLNGNLFVVNKGTSQICRVAGIREGSVTTTVVGESGTGPGQFMDPRGIEVAEDGIVYVVDRNNHRVQAYNGRSANMEWLMMFGGYTYKRTEHDPPDSLNFEPRAPLHGFDQPADVESVDAQTLWVTDTMNARIIRWDLHSYASDTWGSKVLPDKGMVVVHSNPVE
jgi:DNA-binding beta-propeller fold protein YncE